MGGPAFPLRKKSNPPVSSAKDEKELAYLYASNANVSNFVSVRLSGDRNYHLWKKQMLCLLEAHDMRGLVDDGPTPTYSSSKMKKKYDSLLRGWIFGSVSEDVLCVVVHHDSAKPVWKSLELYFGSCKTSDQQDPTKANTTKDKNVLLEEKTGTDKGMIPAKSEAEGSEEETVQSQIGTEGTNEEVVSRKQKSNVILADPEIKEEDVDSAQFDAKCENAAQTKTKDSATTKGDTETKTKGNDTVSRETTTNNKGLRATKAKAELLSEAFFNVELIELHTELQRNSKKKISEKKKGDGGNTILHKAVGKRHNDEVGAILSYIDDDDPEGLTEIKNDKGSTVLHIAVIVENKDAAKLLLKKNKKLLHIKDNQGKTPLRMAYESKRLKTGFVMLKAFDGEESSKNAATPDRNSKSYNILDEYIKILVQAISAKDYVLAKEIIDEKSECAVSNDEVLMAFARTFPEGLNYQETFFRPRLEDIRENNKMIVTRTKALFYILVYIFPFLKDVISPCLRCGIKGEDLFVRICALVLVGICTPVIVGICTLLIIAGATILWMYNLIRLLLLVAYYPFFILHYTLWNFAGKFVPGIKKIERKKKEYEKAKNVLKSVFEKIPKNTSCDLYTKPIIEAACHDAYDVVDQILTRWPEAIQCKGENGYDIIQLATIHRSENIYNLINYTFEEYSKNVHGIMEDSCENNMLHLAGRLTPLNKLKRHTGAALQLQSELQWHKEVKKLVYPTYVTKENIFGDTPEVVFTREHENLVKEGEKWIKAVAESCSITATLIITIVFAAAITVPGGSNQEGVPVFHKQPIFNIFAVSDAISLFSSVTALLVFLSILITRFAEQDFERRLPRRLIIGLVALLVSTTAMIVAFSATLFLVFWRQKLWTIGLICGFAFVPILVFFILQFPLILDLILSTYLSRFGKNNHHKSECESQRDKVLSLVFP